MGPLFSFLLTQQQYISISLQLALTHWLRLREHRDLCSVKCTDVPSLTAFWKALGLADTSEPASDPSNSAGNCSVGRQHLSGALLPGLWGFKEQRLDVEGPLDFWSPEYYLLGHLQLRKAYG